MSFMRDKGGKKYATLSDCKVKIFRLKSLHSKKKLFKKKWKPIGETHAAK